MKPNSFINNLAAVLLFYAAVFAVFTAAVFYFGKQSILTQASFLNWDAQHYFFIKENGYADFRIAFFPLFPLLWKILGATPAIMAFINGLIYSASAAWLLAVFPPVKNKYIFLALSFPSLIFLFLPYSEAVFFLSASLLLVGLHKKNNTMAVGALLLCSITRPVTYIFIPAILGMELLCSDKKEMLKNGFIYSLAVAAGLGITLLIQHHYTGSWFSFFEVQKGWGNYFRLPELPLTSWAGDNKVRLDGTALLAGFIAAGVVILWIKKHFSTKNLQPSKALVFSALYLAGISFFVLFFRGGWLFSLNRFVFATPFFMICLFEFISQTDPGAKRKWIFFLFLSAYWLLFDSYVHIQTILKYEGLSVFLLLFLFLNHSNKIIRTVSFALLITGNILLFVLYYYQFLGNAWIG